ncbi:MAG: V-type ATP synthase subunit F [Oscillospiraceae bacterium]|jgi:V/A-type H+-transporting ATPase subunit F|nr:V-type ATP synthase subunit F [Oscillospiraceae bacterium]
MKFFLISDNVDTLVGLGLVGIKGVITHSEEKVKELLKTAVADEDIAIILITQELNAKCIKWIDDFRLKFFKPLVVQIPDRHGGLKFGGAISDLLGISSKGSERFLKNVV